MKNCKYDYFEIKDEEKNILGRYITSDSRQAWLIFSDIDDLENLSLSDKEALFINACKQKGIEIYLFRNCDRYTI